MGSALILGDRRQAPRRGSPHEHGVTAVLCLHDDADLASKGVSLARLRAAYRRHRIQFHRIPVPDGHDREKASGPAERTDRDLFQAFDPPAHALAQEPERDLQGSRGDLRSSRRWSRRLSMVEALRGRPARAAQRWARSAISTD